MKARSIRINTISFGRIVGIHLIYANDIISIESVGHRFYDRISAETDADVKVIDCLEVANCDTVFFVGLNTDSLKGSKKLANAYYVCPGDNLHFQVWDMPPVDIDKDYKGCRIGMETINICNAHCPMCKCNTLSRKFNRMTLSLSERVVSQAINHPEIQTINMYMNGEPLLDQKLENRIRLANNKGIPYIRISTNATLLTPSRFLSLREAGLDEITISLDAPAQMKHESIRPGTNFNLIIEYLSLIIKEKKERKLLRPGIIIGMIVGDDNYHLMGEMCVFVSNLFGIEIAPINKPGIVFLNDKEGLGMFISKRFDWTGDYSNQDVRKIIPGPCPGYKDLIIFSDGRMPFCCLDSEGNNIIGDLSKDNLDNIVKSSTRRKMISAIEENRLWDIPKNCRKCSLLYEDRSCR